MLFISYLPQRIEDQMELEVCEERRQMSDVESRVMKRLAMAEPVPRSMKTGPRSTSGRNGAGDCSGR